MFGILKKKSRAVSKSLPGTANLKDKNEELIPLFIIKVIVCNLAGCIFKCHKVRRVRADKVGILANNGIKGAEGGTHLRNIILSLQNPTDKAAAQMEALGVSVYDSEGNMRSMNDILGDLNTSMEGMTSEDKANIISTIFNKTDLSSVNALLANTGSTWDSLQSSIENSAGAAQQMADTQLDNLQGQLRRCRERIGGCRWNNRIKIH